MKFTQYLALIPGLLALAAAPAVCGAVPTKPNILLILSDDMGYGDLGIHGCKDIPTPNIDRLATQGVRFTNAHSNGAICSPTRAALMTGLYQNRMGFENQGTLRRSFPTVAERLKAAGYTTALVGKWHLGHEPGLVPLDRGFDEFYGFMGALTAYINRPRTDVDNIETAIWRNRVKVSESRYLTDAFCAEARAFICRQRQASKPFFLYLAFNAVHTPLQATDQYLARVPKTIQNGRRKTYAAMLIALDDAIGKVLKELDDAGLAENTLVLFSNDNGGPINAHGNSGASNFPLRGSKFETFEGGIRVPMLIRWPGTLKESGTYSQAVCSFDLTATILAAAHVDAPGLDGVDLLPYLTGQKQGVPHEALFWRLRDWNNNHAVLQGDWKYVCSAEGACRPGPDQKPGRDMLFNLAEDIGEKNDLSTQHPEKLAELKKLYQAWGESMDADWRRALRQRDK